MDRLIALSLVFCSCSLFVPAERDASTQMVFYYPAASSVQLIGDWNEWGGIAGATSALDPRVGLLTCEAGSWKGDPPDLPRGRYRYAFLVNGSEYFADPLNPNDAFFMDNRVSVLIVD